MFEKFYKKIIVLEGADGSGKDTIVDLLHKKLPDSYVVRFPNRNNETGNIINKILKKEMTFPSPLDFQSLQVCNKIETLCDIDRNPNINPKIFLFCRYYESAYVYGLNDNIPVHLSQILNSVLPKSGMTFILDGKKYRVDNEHYEKTDVQENLAKNYRILARTYNWNIINNERIPEVIADEIIESIWQHDYNTKNLYF